MLMQDSRCFFTGARGCVRLWVPRLFVCVLCAVAGHRRNEDGLRLQECGLTKSVTVKKQRMTDCAGAAKKGRGHVKNEHAGFFCCGALCGLCGGCVYLAVTKRSL